jgi:uncharacterized protein YbaR (Trm112 family)
VIKPELLALLACPQTGQSLSIADAAVLGAVNGKIAAGGVKNVGGADVTEQLTEALAREDGQVIYPVRDDIPMLLIDEGISAAG